MIKNSMLAAALGFAALLGATEPARADAWTARVASVTERPIGAGSHTFTVVFDNGKVAAAPLTSSAVTARFVQMMMAAFLAGKPVYIDTGNTCVPTAAADCPAIGYQVSQ